MRVGVMTYDWQEIESLHHFARLTGEALRRRYDVEQCSPRHLHVGVRERMAMVKAWIARCDVLAVPLDATILKARAEMEGPTPPCLGFVMAAPARGGRELAGYCRYLRANDLLIGNCAAEVEQCREFLPGADCRVLPFPIDERGFYPEPPGAAAAVRERLGIPRGARIISYSGRISLDKNLHTLLRAFSVVRQRLPDCVLVIAGAETNWPLPELGVFALDVHRLLRRQIEALGLAPESVRFVGRRSPEELRLLYNASDLAMNLTINHYENFGLAQVEAMLCGTSTVGSRWGGLRDTIVDGVTGRTVRAAVTESGVKVDWWQAAQAAIAELSACEDERPLRRAACRASALERFSLRRYEEQLSALVDEARARRGAPAAPLAPSSFARDLWTLFEGGDCVPPYRRGPRGMTLYQQLVRPMAGPDGRPLTDDAARLDRCVVICLAAPLIVRSPAIVTIADPVFPMDVTIPEDVRECAGMLVTALQRHPVLRADLLGLGLPTKDLRRALTWMESAGLVLLSECRDDDLVVETCPAPGAPAEIARLDHAADVFYVQ